MIPKLLILFSATLLISDNPVLSRPTYDQTQDWWKTAVVYQIYPRSLKDSNNDGIGDLKGITEKLDHLVDAGVNVLWLSPIYKSPQVDHGYDISDYRDIDETYGTLEDFKVLVATAKSKGLKVILDFVPNHSSDQHEWFKKSERREPGYENYYVWKNCSPDTPPNNWISHFHGPAWTYSELRQQWYLHQFHRGQPDLNYNNPKLVQEMKDILVYWMDLGVDGFRMDIVSAIFEHPDFLDEPVSNNSAATPNDHGYLEHIYTYEQPQTYDMIYQFRALLDQYSKEKGGDVRIMMTESYAKDEALFKYYGNSTHNGAHFPFNFWFITKVNRTSNAHDIKSVIDSWFQQLDKRFVANWVLGNHDQPRVATRYSSENADSLNMISLVLPGVAVTYNGEEIGMENGEVTWEEGQDPQACNGLEENFDRDSRDFQRTPFQWDSSVNAGFNNGAKTWLPVSKKYLKSNLADQKVDGIKSHYRVYQALTKVRQTRTLKFGDLETHAVNKNVLVIVRKLEENPTYALVANIGNVIEKVNLNSLNLPASLEVSIPNVNSEKVVGSSLQSSSVTLLPFESVILKGN